MPKFSVQICCYNSEKYLAQTIESVAAQTFNDWELVVINDGSRDATEAIVRRFIDKRLPINYFYQENKGFASARNRAVALSKGEWIAILDHDDVWHAEKLAVQNASIEKYPAAVLHFSNSEWFTDDGKIERRTIEAGKFESGIVNEPFSKLLGEGCFIDSETVVIRKDALIESGGFDESYRYIVDYDLFLKIAKKHDIYYEDRVLAGWRMHPRQATSVMEEDMTREYIGLLERSLKENGLPAGTKEKIKKSIVYHLNNYSLVRLRKEGARAFLMTLLGGIRKRPLNPHTYFKTLHTFYRAYSR